MKITKSQLKQIIKEEIAKVQEWVVAPGRDSRGEPVDPMNLLEDIMQKISDAYSDLKHPGEQEDFERYLNENVRLMTKEWQEDREFARDVMRAPGER
tara:strand:+ start:256 stop:546 length:291 start_codon:yes stop_codon:yes gene_type:complete